MSGIKDVNTTNPLFESTGVDYRAITTITFNGKITRYKLPPKIYDEDAEWYDEAMILELNALAFIIE